jgi:hypothetical protein
VIVLLLPEQLASVPRQINAALGTCLTSQRSIEHPEVICTRTRVEGDVLLWCASPSALQSQLF